MKKSGNGCSKKFNIRDNYEEVYLSEKSLKKYIDKTEKGIIDNPEFKKAIEYKAVNYWFHQQGNAYFWISHGYEFNDIKNIFLLWGYCFFGSGFKGATLRDNLNVMFRHIDQKINRFRNVADRKFYADEIVRDDHELLESDQDYNHDDKIEQLEETALVSSTEEIPRNKKYIVARNEEIKKNPKKYASELSWYSTSKHISYDVRKTARKICHQNGIDYIQWAENKIRTGYNQNEFDLNIRSKNVSK